jgi:glycosyltransferase involved in cell wall biosynthesis
MPPVEAMACGCPVISSTRGALAEVVGDAAAIIDPEDIRSLKRQMIILAQDAGLRALRRELGLKHAQCFSWEKTAAATLGVYSRAASRINPA